MAGVFPSSFLTKVHMIQRSSEEYNKVSLHIKIICMIFRIYIKKKLFACNISNVWLFVLPFFPSCFSFCSKAAEDWWLKVAAVITHDIKSRQFPLSEAPKASEMQVFPSRCVVWAVTSWWEWVDKTLTLTLLQKCAEMLPGMWWKIDFACCTCHPCR